MTPSAAPSVKIREVKKIYKTGNWRIGNFCELKNVHPVLVAMCKGKNKRTILMVTKDMWFSDPDQWSRVKRKQKTSR